MNRLATVWCVLSLAATTGCAGGNPEAQAPQQNPDPPLDDGEDRKSVV